MVKLARKDRQSIQSKSVKPPISDQPTMSPFIHPFQLNHPYPVCMDTCSAEDSWQEQGKNVLGKNNQDRSFQARTRYKDHCFRCVLAVDWDQLAPLIEEYEELVPRRERKCWCHSKSTRCLTICWFIAIILTAAGAVCTWIHSENTSKNDSCPLVVGSASLQSVAIVGIIVSLIGICSAGKHGKNIIGCFKNVCADSHHRCCRCMKTACGFFVIIMIGPSLGLLQLAGAVIMTYEGIKNNSNDTLFALLIAGTSYSASGFALFSCYSLCIFYSMQD